ncbi:ANTAR domain-containing protein [Murinocardiopsis flavida]|uniref:ANTAR domain-containing protein n=1 Tax=Murinocardiopsis flavida TaxID=645275 RepID=UPI001FEC67A8|nr:ANTAR domain-containing protein [Murinocardiopsis flavida]
MIRRTASGWRVFDGDEVPDLLNAMVLADLLLADEGVVRPAAAPPKAAEHATDEERLRVTVSQLEHALHTRVVVEQAIGVLAERHRIAPRKAFERLRSAARSRGRKVAELARDVIASCNNPLTALPEELARAGAAAEAGPPRRRSR